MENEGHISEVAGSPTTAVEEAKGISLLRAADERREANKGVLYLDIPSWDGDLVASYKVVNRPRLEQMARRIQAEARNGNSSNARTAADIDIILEANTGIYVYDPDGATPEEQRVPLEDDIGVVDYSRVIDVLSRIRPPTKPIKSARQAVLHMFAKEDEDPSVPISTHALTIARWMRDPSKDPATELLGLE